VDVDNEIGLADAIAVLDILLAGERQVVCMDAADANDDGRVNLSDAVILLNHLYGGGSGPANPYPECGYDLTQDELECESYEACP